MNSYLPLVALAAALSVTQQAEVALASPVGFPLEEDPYSLDTKQQVRRGRAGIALGSFGLLFGTVGVALGIGTFTASQSNSDDPHTRRKVGTTLLVVSPIVIGASVFGIVRSRRKLREVRPAPVRPY